MYTLLRKFLFLFEPERAHCFSLKGLNLLHKLHLLHVNKHLPAKPVKLMGLVFKNPVGTAAGLDKSGDFIEAMASLGFGFLELGTVTLKPQVGNPKPRLFRIPEKNALINRMGFNNQGVDYLIENLKKVSVETIIGVSITKNTDTPIDALIDDYIKCYQKLYPHADFISVDCSCPNVPDSQLQQQAATLGNLFKAMKQKQQILFKQHHSYVPILVKLSPDLSDKDLKEIVALILDHGLDGIIATNTTRSRDGIKSTKSVNIEGGLSGAPLFAISLAMVKKIKQLIEDKIPIIAVGGIMSADDAEEMFTAGASLVQIYTGFVYKGPKLVKQIISRLN